jgi:hypothetical protein
MSIAMLPPRNASGRRMPGLGARAARPDAQLSTVEPGDRAASGTQRDQIRERECDLHILDAPVGEHRHLEAPHDPDVEAGPPHVQRDERLKAVELRDRAAAEQSGHRP